MAPETLTASLRLPVAGSYDVIVLGGGIAGISAALSAVRHGARTLLIEKQSVLGGLATSGHVVFYLPICDGRGNRLLGGIPAELLLLAAENGPNTLPAVWRGLPLHAETALRCQTSFNAPAYGYALEALLQKEGCDLLLDTCFCRAFTETDAAGGKTVTGIMVQNADGLSVYKAACFVDASGNACLLSDVGAASTEPFPNILTHWAPCGIPEDAGHDCKTFGCTETPGTGILYIGDDRGNGAPEGSELYPGTSAESVTSFLLRGHAAALRSARENGLELLSIPGMAQLRKIRHIAGAYTLHSEDGGKTFPDEIARVGDWRTNDGLVYSIPYRTLVHPKLLNVLAAGRITAADGDAWEMTRVIPAAAATGQAAGTAASMSAHDGMSCTSLDPIRLKDVLRQDGVLLSK